MQNLLYDKDIFAKWTIGGGYFDRSYGRYKE